MDPVYKRTETYEGWPFASFADLADFIDFMIDLVGRASKPLPSAHVTITFPDHEYDAMTVSELRARSGDMELEEVKRLTAFVGLDSDEVRASLWLVATPKHVDFDVSGRNRVAVDGVNVQGQEKVKKWFDGYRPHRSSTDVEPAQTQAISEIETKSAFQRILSHPVTAGIVATVIGGIILALILSLT
jgi:hypothetical protein